YVLLRNKGGANNWGEVRKLTSGDNVANDGFGYSVATDGDTIIVGAPRRNASRGSAFVFTRNAGGLDNWGKGAELTASDSANGNGFGVAVAADGERVIIGHGERVNTGKIATRVYVFRDFLKGTSSLA